MHSCLFPFPSLSHRTATVHHPARPPPQPDLQLWHEYTNQLLCGPSCAFSRCFTAAPYMTPAVRFDNAEHLLLSPRATNRRGDLSPPFICNVTSMYSLRVTELEKMVELTVWEDPWGFSGDQGTLSWQLEPKKTSSSSRCQSWDYCELCLLKAGRKFTFGSLGIGGHLGFLNLILPTLRTHTITHTWKHTGAKKGAHIQNALHKFNTRKASMSGSDYYVVWLQVQSDLLADDEREGNRATDRETESREIFRFC